MMKWIVSSGFNCKSPLFLLGVCLSPIFISQTAICQRLSPFLPSSNVRTIFAGEVETAPAPDIVYFRPTKIHKKEKEEEKKQQGLARLSGSSEIKDKDDVNAERLEFQKKIDSITPEDLIAKYGDPDKKFPILAQPNAPAPFKGMMAALEIGDQELARRYARQYAEYMKGLSKRTDEVANLVQSVMYEGEQSHINGVVDDSISDLEVDDYAE